MDHNKLEELTRALQQLSPAEQDYIAGFLLVERMQRNRLVMPALHQRIDDAEPENWQPWEQTKQQLDDV